MPIHLSHKEIGTWAVNNTRKAQFLFFLSEISRLSIAFFLGKFLLPRLGINEFFVLSILLLSFAFVWLNSSTKRSDFSNYFKKGLLIVSCSWLLFFGFGSLFSGQSSFQSNVSMAADVQGEPHKGLVQKLLNKKEIKIQFHTTTAKKLPISKKRKILFVILFIISIPLTFYGLILGCSLSCAGYAVFAWMTIILSFGLLGGGIYFLIKAISKKKVGRYKDLDRAGKRKAWKNFFITWGIVTAVAFLALLIGNLAN